MLHLLPPSAFMPMDFIAHLFKSTLTHSRVREFSLLNGKCTHRLRDMDYTVCILQFCLYHLQFCLKTEQLSDIYIYFN